MFCMRAQREIGRTVKLNNKVRALRNRTGWVRTNSLVEVGSPGQKGGRQIGHDKKSPYKGLDDGAD